MPSRIIIQALYCNCEYLGVTNTILLKLDYIRNTKVTTLHTRPYFTCETSYMRDIVQ